MSMGIDSPSVRTHTPSFSWAVGAPAVATASMMEVWKMRGEMKTCPHRSANRAGSLEAR